MIERKGGEKDAPPKKTVKIVVEKKEDEEPIQTNGGSPEDLILANRKKLAEKLTGKKKVEKYVLNNDSSCFSFFLF